MDTPEATILILTLWTGALLGQTFSIDGPSPGITPAVPDDILGPGPVPVGPFPIAFPGPIVVAGSGIGVEVDALSYDAHPVVPALGLTGAAFSVAPGSVGVAGSAVLAESPGGDEAADIYFAGFMFTNILLFDGNGSTGPPLGLPEPSLANLDAVDALTPTPGTVTAIFSVDPATAAGTYFGASPADLFGAPNAPGYSFPGGGVPGVYAAAAALGLAATDDIDAVHYMEDGTAGASAGDMVYFSLAPGSPSLPGLGATAADILVVTPGGVPGIAFTAAAIGLVATDNLDALSMHTPGAGLPVQLKNFNIE